MQRRLVKLIKARGEKSPADAFKKPLNKVILRQLSEMVCECEVQLRLRLEAFTLREACYLKESSHNSDLLIQVGLGVGWNTISLGPGRAQNAQERI